MNENTKFFIVLGLVLAVVFGIITLLALNVNEDEWIPAQGDCWIHDHYDHSLFHEDKRTVKTYCAVQDER